MSLRVSRLLSWGVVLGVHCLIGCGGARDGAGTGSLTLGLVLPDGLGVSQAELRLSCAEAGIDQRHQMSVVGGAAVASIGGLLPGPCVAALSAEAAGGVSCRGSREFVVLAGATVEVEVLALCQGTNQSDDGAALVSTKLASHACGADRIKTVFTTRSSALLGESVIVEARLHQDNVVGTARPLVWSLRNDAQHTAEGHLEAVPCPSAEGSCASFTCNAVGGSYRYGDNGLPEAGVHVVATFEDDECFDTEELTISCTAADLCGDGTVQPPAEECDDGNLSNGDGCSIGCLREVCGDGIVQTPEECDGSDGLLPGQLCSPTCFVIPICGNGVVERDEECDSADPRVCTPPSNPRACRFPVNPDPSCFGCIAAIPVLGTFFEDVCQPDALCMEALTCLSQESSCWAASPKGCFCGDRESDLAACEEPGFVAQGACAAELRAGAGGATTPNAKVLDRYFDSSYPAGAATLIWSEALLQCNEACGFF